MNLPAWPISNSQSVAAGLKVDDLPNQSRAQQFTLPMDVRSVEAHELGHAIAASVFPTRAPWSHGVAFHAARIDYFHGVTDWITFRGDNASGTAAARAEIADASEPAEIVFALERFGLARTAKRVAYLASLHHDEGEPEVNLDSLKQLVHTMIANPAWGEPSLTLNDEGCAHAEWKTRGAGRVMMTFLSSGRMDYAAISAPAATPGVDILNIGGHHIEEEAIKNLHWFTDRIVAR